MNNISEWGGSCIANFGGVALHNQEEWGSRSKAKGLQPQSPRPWAYIACEAVNPLFRCDLIPLKLLYYDVIICRVIQVNYVLNEIYGLNAFN